METFSKSKKAFMTKLFTTIAEKVGYGSVLAFSKAFKQIEAMSPRKFILTFTGLNDL
ncbi:hypothetical protein [Paenibacillus sp. PL91]|uniref:hypothetical protein n=1 Tax=Paenibacillus sp. PL91 TaxID=2729538 RepID=UPI0016598FAF|nr:hypothetical protein [Paenibacillus sp. PL91]MBC9202709.1 hypothetical protein [Paenibacillus sp. PL91]